MLQIIFYDGNVCKIGFPQLGEVLVGRAERNFRSVGVRFDFMNRLDIRFSRSASMISRAVKGHQVLHRFFALGDDSPHALTDRFVVAVFKRNAVG